MSIDIFEQLVGQLTAAKQAKAENQSLSLADLGAVVVQLKAKLPEILSREIRGSRLTRSDAQKQSEQILQLYRLVREMQAQATREIETARQTALAERRIVYLPAKHPEEP